MRSVLVVLSMFVAVPAWAEWVKVTETADAVYYVDPATITRDGTLRRVSAIQDYAKPGPDGARSRRSTLEIDCADERLRSRSVTEHSEPMGGGGIVAAREAESNWSYVAPRTGTRIAPRTPDVSIVRFVCSR